MQLYSRDYTKLTNEEKKEYEKIMEEKNRKDLIFRKAKHCEYSKGIRHYLRLFPNNYMDICEIREKNAELKQKLNQYKKVLDESNGEKPEQKIIDYIKRTESYFLIASILHRNYNFGHHGAYVFPEFQIGINYKADYLIVGDSTDGYGFVFCELQSPINSHNKKITHKDGSFGAIINDGIKQLDDWRRKLESDYACIRDSFVKALHPEKSLPNEFIEFDSSRMNYVVIAGRRKDFNSKTHRQKRESQYKILYYDLLYDYASDLLDGERWTY